MRDQPDIETGRNVFLTGYLQLPEPLWELMRWSGDRPLPSQTQDWPNDANVGAWVQRVGLQTASFALVQLAAVLECPQEVLWAFRGIPWDPASPFGWVQFFGAWSDSLCRELGLPAQPLPTEAEWCGIGTRRRTILAELARKQAELGAAPDCGGGTGF